MITETISELPVLAVEQNAWRCAQAERVGMFVDASGYFEAVENAMGQARHEIFIIGWDFNPDIKLRPEQPDSLTLGAFLLRCVERNPALRIKILIWALGPVYSGKSLKLLMGRTWPRNRAISMRFDLAPAIRGSHHQKLVIIDGVTAFTGGIDLTARRWDNSAHEPDNPLRVSPDGKPYEPVHDVQCLFSGEAAAAAREVARERWRNATGEDAPPPPATEPVWPAGYEAQFHGSMMALSRAGRQAARGDTSESFRLTRDLLASARRQIYIESQYFASPAICDLLCERLQEPDGPEVVILTTAGSHGFLERKILGENRDRLIRKLVHHDRYGRLRARYPAVSGRDGGVYEILVHSKLIIIDDTVLRVGSSNLNQRSELMDTELDVSLWARSGAERAQITRFRDGLLGEHLGVDSETLKTEMERSGSLCAAIDNLAGNSRSLLRFEGAQGDGETCLVPGTGIVDPRCAWWPLQTIPQWFSQLRARFMPRRTSCRVSHR